MQAFIGNIIMLATYLMFSIYTIKNSKPLAEWIGNRASLQGDINFALNKTELLFALFLGLGIFGLIDEIPSLLSGLYDHIQDNNNYSLDLDLLKPRKDLLITQAVKTALFLILVIYARTFAEYFSSKINNVEPEDEINSKTD